MNLDIDKIATIRKRECRQLHNLDYVLDGIRRELEGRLQEKRSVETESAGSNNCLVIDFQSGDIKPDGYDNVKYISLLEKNEDNSGTPGTLDALADESIDCVVENLQVCWLDFGEHLNQINRVLKTNGIYLFSCFNKQRKTFNYCYYYINYCFKSKSNRLK